MVRTQITLDSEMQKRARRRASDLGVSLAERRPDHVLASFDDDFAI
jgi:hypothetical protein